MNTSARIPGIEQAVEKRINHMTERHRKVLSVRMDVRFPKEGYEPNGGNREISEFIKRLKETYTDNGNEMHYVWAREKKEEQPPGIRRGLIVVIFDEKGCRSQGGKWHPYLFSLPPSKGDRACRPRTQMPLSEMTQQIAPTIRATIRCRLP